MHRYNKDKQHFLSVGSLFGLGVWWLRFYRLHPNVQHWKDLVCCYIPFPFKMTTTMLKGHSTTVLCITSSEGSTLLSGAEEGEACTWDPQGRMTAKHKFDDDIASVCFTKSGLDTVYVASGARIHHCDLRQGLAKPIHTYNVNRDEINQIVARDNYLATCDDTNVIKIINTQDRKLYKTLIKHENICTSVCFRPKRTWEVISGGLDCNLINWDFSKGKARNVISMQEIQCHDEIPGPYLVNPPFIHAMHVSPCANYLVCGLENGCVQLFDISKKQIQPLRTLKEHTQGVGAVTFSPVTESAVEENILITGGNDSKIIVWKLNSSTKTDHDFVVHRCINHTDKINNVQSWADQKILAADQSENISVYKLPEF